MSHIINVPYSQGYVSTGDNAKSAYDLSPGEMTEMKGAFYRKNDGRMPFKMPGRALFGSAGSTAVKGLAICQFDEGGTDKLLAYLSTTIYAATPGTTGTFASLITGLNASATRLTACHQDDRWYLGNGYDKNKCLKSDGTTRDMGMPTPQVKLTAAATSTTGGSAAPTSSTGSFVNPTNAYDAAGDATYASGTLAAPGTVTHTWTTWASDATAARTLIVRWSLAGLPLETDDGGSSSIGTGGDTDAGYNVTVLLEKSEDAGTTWSQVYRIVASSSIPIIGTSKAITANSNLVHFRATLTYGSGTNDATLRIYDVAIKFGATITPFTITDTMYYSYTYYNDADDLEGPPGSTTPMTAAAFGTSNLVTLTRSETPPTHATHWRIYRTVPGAANTIDSLGLLWTADISETTYLDSFDQIDGTFLDPTIQLTPTVPAISIGDLPIPRDTQPPAFLSMISWKGSICGISRTNRRALRYSEAGRPESFPEFYVVTSFPLDEHDGLVGQMAVGETLVLLCEGAVLALDDLSRVVDGQFNGADARPLKGHPGCVGNYAYTTYSVAGEPRGAWVSPYGVYITNGQTCDPISDDLAWEEEVNVDTLASSVLRWDAKNLILWFEFDSNGDGLNDREMPFHMAQAHEKGSNHPKLGQPTPKASSCMAAALLGTKSYRYSGHPSNGAVYLEESGYADAATGVGVEMVLTSGKITTEKTDIAVQKATIIHSDFGAGEQGTLTTTTYRDAAGSSQSVTKQVDLSGHRGTTVAVLRAGEAIQQSFVYSGPGLGGVIGIQNEVDGHGRSGSANRWLSASATP